MKKITLQDIFDAAWQAFIVEGKPPAVGGGGGCAYLTDDGRKCAIGLVLPDGHPAQLFRGTANVLIHKYPELWDDSIIHSDNIDGLNAIQCLLHDNLVNQISGQWRINLRERYLEVAKDFNLTVPE